MDQKEPFSPLKLPASPGLNYVGNLTGHPRKMKDNVADCFHTYQRWKQLCNDGSAVLSKVTAFKGKTSSEGEKDSYPEDLTELSDMLQNVIEQQEEVVEKMKLLNEQAKAMSDLLTCQSDPLFLSWPPQRFLEAYDRFKTSLERELHLKRRIAELVCHTSSGDSLMFLQCCWNHSPYLHPRFDVTMDALLTETGHRPH